MLRELFDRPPHHDSKNQPLPVGFFCLCPEVECQLQRVFHITGQLQVRTTGWRFPVGDHAQINKSGDQSDRVWDTQVGLQIDILQRHSGCRGVQK